MLCDTLWTRARLATMASSGFKADPGTGLGIVDDGAVAALDGRILYAGPMADMPPLEARETVRCDGRWILPGIVDPHTHLVHGGNRAEEFELRLAGASYEEIARRGGGILSTMRATRALGEDGLVAAALPRLDAMMGEGVTTIEIKSGYGLSLESELAMLRAARALGHRRKIRVRTTLLGAHALPPEYADNVDGYVDLVCEQMIPAAAREGLADAVDAFCEGIGFTLAQTERVLAAARAHGLPIKLHAEQLSNLHGAALAARMGALSADHLEHLDGDGVQALARAGTVATLLPGAYYFTRETRLPPLAALRAAGVPMALATDCNPGTSPLTSPLLVLNMAATLFRMTVTECLRGVTIEAARALGLAGDIGSLEAGKACDLSIWDIERPADLVYRMGMNPLHARIWKGVMQ